MRGEVSTVVTPLQAPVPLTKVRVGLNDPSGPSGSAPGMSAQYLPLDTPSREKGVWGC